MFFVTFPYYFDQPGGGDAPGSCPRPEKGPF
jgi:hypothetical protein